MSAPKKKWSEMTTFELAEATRAFDRPETTPPPVRAPAGEREKVLKAIKDLKRQRRGRPAIGKGASRVLVTLEKGLLSEAERYRKRHGLKRSQLIAEALRDYIRKAG